MVKKEINSADGVGISDSSYNTISTKIRIPSTVSNLQATCQAFKHFRLDQVTKMQRWEKCYPPLHENFQNPIAINCKLDYRILSQTYDDKILHHNDNHSFVIACKMRQMQGSEQGLCEVCVKAFSKFFIVKKKREFRRKKAIHIHFPTE